MNYKSAFSIGDKAQFSLDNFAAETLPCGRIDGIMFYGEQVLYRVSLFVNEGGSDSEAKAYLHQGRPVDGFTEGDLKRIDRQYIDHVGHVGQYEPVEALDLPCDFEIGELVEVRIDLSQENPDFFNIPVEIAAVRYEEGKVLYDVCILRQYYFDGTVAEGNRLVKDHLYGLDSIYLKPVGGWPALGIAPVTSGRVDGTKENQGNVPRSI